MNGNFDLDPGEEPGKDNEMIYEHQKNSRRRDSDSEDCPYTKQARNEETGKQTTENHTYGTVTQGTPQENVILIQITNKSNTSNFNHPIRLTEAINKSIFQKYIIENSLRVIGDGKAIRFEVVDISKIGPLNEIKYLGNWEINCKQPASNNDQGCSYGTISPVETDIEIEEIKEKTKILWGPDTYIKDITRIHKPSKISGENKWIPTKSLKITFRGPLPNKLTIGHISYKVYQYTFPISKCFKCLMYGHGLISCKNKIRCSKCSQQDHKYKDCKNPPHCFFCKGNHTAYDKTCPIHQKAQEINKKNTTPNNLEVKKLFHHLNPTTQKQNQPIQKNIIITTAEIHNSETDYKQQTDDNTNTIQQTNPNITQTYAKILTQTNNITPAQKTPTKQKNNTNRAENTPTQSTKSKQKNSQEKTKEQTHTKEQNIKDKKLTESPITWSLPTPLNKTPTIKEKKKKEEEEEQKNKEEKPSFVEITKGIFKLITNITEKFKSDKTIIEIITEIITEVAPILKQISVWFND